MYIDPIHIALQYTHNILVARYELLLGSFKLSLDLYLWFYHSFNIIIYTWPKKQQNIKY